MSVFDGFDALINEALELTPGQSIDHKSICNKFEPTKKNVKGIKPLVFALYNQVDKNWQGRPPSETTPSILNWKPRRKINMVQHNPSPETLLERSIAIIANRKFLEYWHNQIPIASGLINSTSDKGAAVDLIYLNDDQLELVELKWESNTPLYAIFEILRYGLAYLFCYKNREKFGYQDLNTMTVSRVILSTLAPIRYYAKCDLQWLVDALQLAVNTLFLEVSDGMLSCEFKCNVFPEDFALPFSLGEEVSKLETCSSDDATLIYIMDNIQGISHVEWNRH